MANIITRQFAIRLCYYDLPFKVINKKSSNKRNQTTSLISYIWGNVPKGIYFIFNGQ